jgi:hypothetical protein
VSRAQHPDWCARDHRCRPELGEHRSRPRHFRVGRNSWISVTQLLAGGLEQVEFVGRTTDPWGVVVQQLASRQVA